MLKSGITVDLPSAQMENPSGPVAWIKGIFGMQRDVSGQEALTVGGLQLLSGIADAFEKAHVTNVISLLVDDEPVYLDTADVEDDVDAMLAAARDKDVADRSFQDMRIAFTHSEQGLHAIIELAIENEVVLGTEEMEVELSAQIQEFTVTPGESPARFAERVRATVNSPVRMETYRRDLHALTERIAGAVREVMPNTTVTTMPAHFEVARPSQEEMGYFRHLEFGRRVQPRAYRPRPQARAERETIADPFAYYFHDPYLPFTRWIVVDAMLKEGALGKRSTRVLRPDGSREARGDSIKRDLDIDKAGLSAVSFADDGSIVVAPHLPDPGEDPTR